MILVFDIGNTNVTVGVYKNDTLLFISRLHTKRQLTKDQYVMELAEILKLNHVDPSFFKGAIISSVVPSITNLFKYAIKQLIRKDPLILNLNLKLDLPINIRYPETLGADLICSAVAALNKVGAPCIVIDLGTATTFSVIDKNKSFIGCSIVPGLKTSFDSLISQTELLSVIDFDIPTKIIGNDTSSSVNSGLIFGTASMIDGLCARIENELGYKCNTIATGGFSKRIIKYCNRNIDLSDNLVLEGLNIIYNKNTEFKV